MPTLKGQPEKPEGTTIKARRDGEKRLVCVPFYKYSHMAVFKINCNPASGSKIRYGRHSIRQHAEDSPFCAEFRTYPLRHPRFPHYHHKTVFKQRHGCAGFYSERDNRIVIIMASKILEIDISRYQNRECRITIIRDVNRNAPVAVGNTFGVQTHTAISTCGNKTLNIFRSVKTHLMIRANAGLGIHSRHHVPQMESSCRHRA